MPACSHRPLGRTRWGTTPRTDAQDSGSDRGLPQWCSASSPADHRRMTTEQPTARRVLRRRGDDRVIGGVASGLADYFNVDPLLIRIGFVGLMVFNGLGLGLYLLGWLFIPTDTDGRSVVQRILGSGRRGPSRRDRLDPPWRGQFLVQRVSAVRAAPGLRRDRGHRAGHHRDRRRDLPTAGAETPSSRPRPGASKSAPRPPPRRLQPVVVRRPPRPASPLGWYVLGAMLVGIGLLALITGITGRRSSRGATSASRSRSSVPGS